MIEECNKECQKRLEQESHVSNSELTVKSLLTVLKAPKQSELTRKRKVAVNPPTGKCKCKKSQGSANVKPLQRINEFPDQNLIISSEKLFCSACREQLSLKKSIIKNHIRSAKDLDGKFRL